MLIGYDLLEASYKDMGQTEIPDARNIVNGSNDETKKQGPLPLDVILLQSPKFHFFY